MKGMKLNQQAFDMFDAWKNVTQGLKNHQEILENAVKAFHQNQSEDDPGTVDEPNFNEDNVNWQDQHMVRHHCDNNLYNANCLAGIMLNDQAQALWNAFVGILSDPDMPLSDNDRQSIFNNVGVTFAFSKSKDYGNDIMHKASDDPSVADPTIKKNNVHPNYYADQGKGHHDLAYHEDQMFPKPWIEGNCVITAIKYLKRFKSKNGVEDIKKARTYLDRLIKLESEK